MSDTPRTDAALIDIGHPLTEPNTVTADFARTLEREIAKLKIEVKIAYLEGHDAFHKIECRWATSRARQVSEEVKP